MMRMRGIALVAALLLYTPFGICEQKPILDAVKGREVLIQRDRWGVPHIYGQSIAAVAFGNGYAQAEDHLDGMLRLYLKARGERSRVEGPSAVEQDLIERRLMHREIVERTWNAVPQASRDCYQAFADGINRYIETHPKERQPWYWKVQAQDVATYMRFTMIRNGLFIAMGKMGTPGAGPPAASNAWAISASRSASGHAMLHADPHLPWSGDVRMGYEVHLKCPEMDVAGTGYIGEPLPLIGHNADVAWTATNNAANTADVFAEKIDPQNPDRYLDSDGQWKLMEKRTIRMEVRQSDGSMHPVEETLRYTRRGPYFESHGRGYSVAIARWSDFPDPLTGSILRAKVRDVDDFKASLAEHPLDKWNLVYADRQGNIYYVDNGVFPKRGAGYDFSKPVPGWERGAQWNGYVAFRDLPQFTNPANGLIVNCNNSPYSSVQPPLLDPANFAPYLAHSFELTNASYNRAGHAFELFAQYPKISWEDSRRIALDVKAINVGPFVRILLQATEGQDDPDLREVHAIFQNWDGLATVDNRAMPILKHWERVARERKVALTAAPGREQSLAILKQAVAEMKQLYGKVSVPLGQVQVFAHGKEYPVPGANSLFFVNTGVYRDGKWYATQGSSWLMLIEFSTPLKVLTIAPLGESDDPSSPHFADQTAMFSRQELKPFPFADDEVKALSEKSYRLKM